MNHLTSTLAAIVLAASAIPAVAGQSVKATVNGMVCAFCAQGIEKRLGMLDLGGHDFSFGRQFLWLARYNVRWGIRRSAERDREVHSGIRRVAAILVDRRGARFASVDRQPLPDGSGQQDLLE